MSNKSQDIQGNLNISRNLTVGSHGNIEGNLEIGHHLKVKGWVDAPHIKGPLKGLFASEESLKAAYPLPMPGWFALVGNTLPADVWRSEGGKWVKTGEKGGEFSLWLDVIESDIHNLTEETKDLREDLNDLKDEVTDLSTDVGNLKFKTSPIIFCKGFLNKGASPSSDGVYLQRDSDGDPIQIVTKNGDSVKREIPEEGIIYTCEGKAYIFNGIMLIPSGHSYFIFDGGKADSTYGNGSAIGGGKASTDFTISKRIDCGGARFV